MHYSTLIESDEFVDGYIEALFFTASGDPDDPLTGDEPFSFAAIRQILVECEAFRIVATPWLNRAKEHGYSLEQAGRDFWFTRNRHGVGFSDRDELTSSLGYILSKKAEQFEEVNPYVGDDGLIYLG